MLITKSTRYALSLVNFLSLLFPSLSCIFTFSSLSSCLSNVEKNMTIIREIKKRISIILRVAVIISSAWLIVVIFFTTILNRPSLYKTDFSKRLSSSVKKSASSISPDDEFLIKHPVFKNFNIIPPVQKKNVRLLVIVTTAPQRNDRREAIRNTWWTRCKNQVWKIFPSFKFHQIRY